MIHCIGDSHAKFFSGNSSVKPKKGKPLTDQIPIFKTHSLGPILAYSLNKNGTTSRGRERVLEVLKDIPREDYILLAFGEIDCRAHIIKQAKFQNKNEDEIIKNCVDNYFSLVMDLKKRGYKKIILWNVIPSTRFEEKIVNDYPTVGSCIERNQVTRKFNRYLNLLANDNGILTISIFDKLIDKEGLTKMEYYQDKIHLAPNALPLALEEFNKIGLNLISRGLTFALFRIKCGYKTAFFKFKKSFL